ncbi:lactate racemase domain-containing protein [Lentisphaera profundi]|uniref:Lactate racemase domain-containing protein n=1 Tax=Lentisphaera profundi TaxID=1658616 RepID=A0ABY7VQE3_9BACT|nr:lactate racemase domain-containing protein [Lentisphaera profundi]WDE95534.1 lactate racemase domain-containing protein [Lentisphaera profundi]
MLINDGAADRVISKVELEAHLDRFIAINCKGVKRLLLLPPDHTRLNSRAGEITAYLYENLKDQCEINLMPALGTHVPMTPAQLHMMFGKDIPLDSYMPHDWRNALEILGELSAQRINELSEGKLNFPMEVAVNKEVFNNYDLIVSIGQIVPHEVIGMANYTKNVMIGVGGGDTINKSHYLGAVYGMERIMGETDSPVRRALNESYDEFVRPRVNLQFILTVIGKEDDELVLRGLYSGAEDDVFETACELSQEVNLDKLKKPIQKCVVYLDPEEFNSTWLGNKAVYRTRKAMADNGELIVLAPDLHTFGEDPEIDRMIRKYGYLGTAQTLKDVEENEDLANNLSAAAHLIHGTSDGRFKITYCPGPKVSKEEILMVGFDYASYKETIKKYDPAKLKDGWNIVDGEEIFYISNPALGLWTV